MKCTFLISIISLALFACQTSGSREGAVIAVGQMPTMTIDTSGTIQVVYGSGDSILYLYSSDQGESFSAPSLISVLPGLAASHTRGPQIIAITDGLVVAACNAMGDIFSYTKDPSGKWSQALKVNDLDTVAKETLMALAGDRDMAFAVWLDVRDGHNRINGARSRDTGKSWSKNILV
jgi:hypothetical protein